MAPIRTIERRSSRLSLLSKKARRAHAHARIMGDDNSINSVGVTTTHGVFGKLYRMHSARPYCKIVVVNVNSPPRWPEPPTVVHRRRVYTDNTNDMEFDVDFGYNDNDGDSYATPQRRSKVTFQHVAARRGGKDKLTPTLERRSSRLSLLNKRQRRAHAAAAMHSDNSEFVYEGGMSPIATASASPSSPSGKPYFYYKVRKTMSPTTVPTSASTSTTRVQEGVEQQQKEGEEEGTTTDHTSDLNDVTAADNMIVDADAPTQADLEPEEMMQAEAPVEAVEAVEAPVEAVEAPVEAVEAPVEAVEAAMEAVEAPVEAVEAPVEAVEAAMEAVEAPVEAVEAAMETPGNTRTDMAAVMSAVLRELQSHNAAHGAAVTAADIYTANVAAASTAVVEDTYGDNAHDAAAPFVDIVSAQRTSIATQ